MAQPKRLTKLPEEIIDMILWDVSKISSVYSMMWLRGTCRVFKNQFNRIIPNGAAFESHGGLMYQFWALDKPGKRWLRFPYEIRLQYLKRLRDMKPIPGGQPRCYFYLWLSEMQQLDVFKCIPQDDQPHVVEQLVAGAALGEFNPWHLAAQGNVDIHRHRRQVPVDGWHGTWLRESTESVYYSLLVCRAIHDRDLADMEKWLRECGTKAPFAVRFNLGPLKLAARSGTKDVVRTLLRYNYPPSLNAPYEGTHLLATAVEHNNREAMEVWMDHIKNDTSDGVLSELTLAIRAAVIRKDTWMIDLILNTWHGDTQPLMYQGLLRAIFLQDLAMLQFLLCNTSLDPDFKPKGLTEGPIAKAMRKCTPEDVPLLIAAKKGDHELVSLLLDYGAGDDSHRWSILPNKGTLPTIMRYAVLHGDGKLIRLLLHKGLDPRFEIQRHMYKVVVPTKRTPSLGQLWKELQWERDRTTEGIDLERVVDYSVKLLHQPLQAPVPDVSDMDREAALKRWQEKIQKAEQRLLRQGG